MSLSITKNSYEKFPISIDFSSLLGLGESISSKFVACNYSNTGADVTTSLVDSSSISSPKVIVVIKNGTTLEFNVTYILTVMVTTNYSNVFNRQIEIIISDDYQDEFSKEVSESFIIKVDFINELEIGDTLASTTVLCYLEDGTDVSADIVTAALISGTAVYIWVQGGVAHHFYTFKVRIVTVTTEYKYSRTIKMEVGENLDVLY